MLSQILSASVYGVDAIAVEVETNLESGLPMFIVVGLPDSAVKESRERVTTAIKNSGFVFPTKRITVNLAPADVKKEGTAFDLPIALGILASSGVIETETLNQYVVLGELALDGTVRKISGALPAAVMAKQRNAKALLVPKENAKESAVVDGLAVYGIGSLKDAVELLTAEPSQVASETVDLVSIFDQTQHYGLDFAEVKGQAQAKRALEVAAAGGHNIIMIGSPGSGKTMLAKRLPTILPPLELAEALETTKIYSVAGLMPSGQALITTRPFRSPHHTVSDVALVGGGTNPKPGEISLAHNGVLFLDELPEFSRSALEVMRQPLEDGDVTISRATMSVKYPTNFMLVAAMNPSPAGSLKDPNGSLTATPQQIQRYLSKISGPLLDRIDIHIEVPTVKYEDLASAKTSEPSSAVRERVLKARRIQKERFAALKGKPVFCNAQMSVRHIREFCKLDDASEKKLGEAMTRMNFSARAHDRILKVSRTIADLDASPDIQTKHVLEAIQYRGLDRDFWG